MRPKVRLPSIREAALWMEDKRYAGVSAFGFGGTNFHAVLESGHEAADQHSALQSCLRSFFCFREGILMKQAKKQLSVVKALLEDNDNISLKDIAYSLALGSTKPIQLSIVADRDEDLIMKIDLALSGVESKDTYITKKKRG